MEIHICGVNDFTIEEATCNSVTESLSSDDSAVIIAGFISAKYFCSRAYSE